MYCGTHTFWQRGLWDSCFQNPSESSARSSIGNARLDGKSNDCVNIPAPSFIFQCLTPNITKHKVQMHTGAISWYTGLSHGR